MGTRQLDVNEELLTRWKLSEDSFLKGDLAGALFILKKLAKEGFEPAYLEIGNIYELGGGGVEKDLNKAEYWYKRSASSLDKNSSTHLALGRIYLQSKSDKIEAAISHFERVKHQEMGALFGLGLIYENGLGVQKSLTKAIDYYQQAADAGHIMAKARLEGLLVQPGPFWRLRKWLRTRYQVAKLLKSEPSVRDSCHPKLGISTCVNLQSEKEHLRELPDWKKRTKTPINFPSKK